jgi:hypothetical protein
MLRGGSAEIGIMSGCQGSFLERRSYGLVSGFSRGMIFVWAARVGRAQKKRASLGATGSARGRHPRRACRCPTRGYGRVQAPGFDHEAP